MRVIDIVSLAFTNLHRRKLRTLLTVVGVIIGTVCIVMMVSLGYSSYRQLSKQIEEDQSLRQVYVYSDLPDQSIVLNDDLVYLLTDLPQVEQAFPQLWVPVTLHLGPYMAQTDLIGTDPSVLPGPFEQGSFVLSDSQSPMVVLGSEVQSLFHLPGAEAGVSLKTDQVLGGSIKLCLDAGALQSDEDSLTRTFFGTVTGVLKAGDSPFSSGDQNAVYVDLSYVLRILQENRSLSKQLNVPLDRYPVIIVQAKTLDDVAELLAQLQSWGIQGSSSLESIRSLQQEQQDRQLQLLVIGSIALLVASIGIANTMFANLSEQQREIAVLKVIGMRLRDVRRMALCEAGFLGLAGGLLGLLVSYAIIALLSSGLISVMLPGLQGLSLTIPVWLSLSALSCTTGIGVLAGVYPACKTAKMSVLDALR